MAPPRDDPESRLEHDESRSEETPLLGTDLPPDVAPDKKFQALVISMCVLFIFIVEAGVEIMNAPGQQVLEDILCREHFPDHKLGVLDTHDERCKSSEVQKDMTMLRSWDAFTGMLIPMVVQIPYGIVADKYGRRLVLFLSLFGIAINMGENLLVLAMPNRFSAWAVIWGNVATLIGGGGNMVSAMVYTLLSDAIPVDTRTSVFYGIYAMALILKVVINPISAMLMNINPWLALWLGYGILIVGMFTALLIPETLTLRRMVDSKRRGSISGAHQQDGDEVTPTSPIKQHTWFQNVLFSVKNNTSHIVHFIFTAKGIVLLLCAYSISFLNRLTFQLYLLQYLTKRFGWDWSTATYISTVKDLSAVFILLLLLPAASAVLVKRFGYSPVRRDLLLGRIVIGVASIGTFMTSVAWTPWLVIPSLSVASAADGLGAILRALLNAIVEPHTIATLNTTVSMLEALVGLPGGPGFGWLLNRGLDLGGAWTGMPFLVGSILSMIGCGFMIAFRIPAGFAVAHAPS